MNLRLKHKLTMAMDKISQLLSLFPVSTGALDETEHMDSDVPMFVDTAKQDGWTAPSGS